MSLKAKTRAEPYLLFTLSFSSTAVLKFAAEFIVIFCCVLTTVFLLCYSGETGGICYCSPRELSAKYENILRSARQVTSLHVLNSLH